MIDRGLQARHLDTAGLAQAKRYFDRYPALAWNDCLALRMAEETEAAILLTGDGLLRRIATEKAMGLGLYPAPKAVSQPSTRSS